MKSRDKALSQLRKSLRSDDRGCDLPEMKPMQKVSVMADSKEGLEKGLEKAEDVLEKSPMLADSESEELPMIEEDAELESGDSMEDSSLDSILSSLKPEQLQALKAKIESMV
jgi:hypothetical protein